MKSCHTHAVPRIRAYAFAFCSIIMVATSLWTAAPASAQSARIVHKIVSQNHVPPPLGRDLWFSMIQNYDDQQGKYYALYVTSPKNTTAYVESGGFSKGLSVPAYGVAVFNIPLGWEIKSSGVPEPKAIHVYSKDADLSCYLMSHNPYTSDGMYIIPTIGWGTDYVVAGYEALYEFTFDYPSEFSVIANQDNTLVQITPSCDLRQGSNTGYTPDYPAGQQFSVILQKGEAVQYKSTRASSADAFDVSGTVIHSNVPVGVVGGSTCPNIPPDYPYCDHVCEMIPPIRTWAKTYYVSPFFQPPGMSGHDYSSVMVIGTKKGQVIHRYDAASGDHVHCIIDNKYGTYLVPDVLEASKFWSDDPFLCVQYINSSTYPDMVNGQGDPAEIVINPVENFSKTAIFQIPVSRGSITAVYTSYVNIIVNENAIHSTTVDGKSIANYTHRPVDGKYEIYRITGLQPGAHVVQSDSACGTYIYGYGFDESFGWAGGFGTGTYGSQDTLAPIARPDGACFTAHIPVVDPDTGVRHSKIGMVRVDSIYNMGYALDPNFVEGKGFDSTFYDIQVVDLNKDAIIVVSTFDEAGNQTTVTSTYTPMTATIVPPLRNFGVGNIGGNAIFMYDTIHNTGEVPYTFSKLHFLLGTQGFTIDSGLTPNVLPVGGTRVLKIGFIPLGPNAVSDTIEFGDDCVTQNVAVVGSGGAPDFYVDNQSWLNQPITDDPMTHIKAVVIHNLSKSADVHFPSETDVTWPDTTHFYMIPGQFPVTVPMGGTAKVMFTFRPTDQNTYTTNPAWRSPDVVNGNGDPLPHQDKLTGNAVSIQATAEQNIVDTISCVDASTKPLPLTFKFTRTGSQQMVIAKIVHSSTDTTLFNGFQGILPNGLTFDPNRPQPLESAGDYVTVSENFVPPMNTNGVFTDTITAYDDQTPPNVIGQPLIATIYMVYHAGSISTTALNLGRVNFGGAVPPVQTFDITDTTNSDLTVSSVALLPGNPTNDAFHLTYLLNNQASQGPPMVLHTNDKLTVEVHFDSTSEYALTQINAQIGVTADWCNNQPPVALSIAQSLGNDHPSSTQLDPIVACNNGTITVGLQMQQYPANPHVPVDTITDVQISGPDKANFAFAGLTLPILVPSGTTKNVQVTFLPDPASDKTYNAQVDFTVNHDPTQISIANGVVSQPITATAGIVKTTATSMFATPSGAAGDVLTLPINLSVDKGVLATTNMNLSDLNVTGARFVYTLANPDLLHIDPTNVAGAISGLPKDWKVDPANSSFKGNKLIITMTGKQAIDDNVHTFGQIAFLATLSKDAPTTDVHLDTMQLYTGDNGTTPIGGCVTPVVQSGNFNLILRCGDATMSLVMAGKGDQVGFIKPATPNPVSGGTVTFQYANKVETNLTLSIYDALGKEVLRPIDNVRHDAGAWQISTDVTNLASGAYTYRLTNGHVVASGQFVIQR